MFRVLAALFLIAAQGAYAAPQKLTAVYHATRSGQPFATVTETFRQEGGRYQLESITEGLGVYALFGKRRLSSEGVVTPEGLRPEHFQQQQGDNVRKAVRADFDWQSNTLTMTSKGQAVTAPLDAGTQDVLSYAYQFMFHAPQGDEVVLPVTTGKKLRIYRYRVAEREVAVETAAGSFRTLHLVNGKEGGGDDRQLWLGLETHHIPVRIVMQDENGATIEQELTSLHVE